MYHALLLFAILLFNPSAMAQGDSLTFTVKALKQAETQGAAIPVDIYWGTSEALRDSSINMETMEGISLRCRSKLYYRYRVETDTDYVPYHSIDITVSFGGSSTRYHTEFNTLNGQMIGGLMQGSIVTLYLHRPGLDGEDKTDVIIFHIVSRERITRDKRENLRNNR